MNPNEAVGPRRVSRLVEPFHAMTYYTPEILRMRDYGFKGWWHAYFAYRSSAMGAVSAGTVAAAFFNFAPRMVERAVPNVWDIMPPHEVAEIRMGLVDEALRRSFGDLIASPAVVAAAELARRAIDGCNGAARPVFGAYTGVAWPEEPHLALWHACTLFRELRGDSHHIALAAAGIDGVECHVLMAANGHGNRDTILGIRGWNEAEWASASHRLTTRGWLTAGGQLTEHGREQRVGVERHTDELSNEPCDRLGAEGVDRFESLMAPLVDHLVSTGEISLGWPPPSVSK